MTMTTANYLDIQNWIVNEVIGSVIITYIVLLVLIIAWAYQKKLTIQQIIPIWLVYSLFFITAIYNLLIAIIIALILALIYYIVTKSVTR